MRVILIEMTIIFESVFLTSSVVVEAAFVPLSRQE
jgi:hypothetical protein